MSKTRSKVKSCKSLRCHQRFLRRLFRRKINLSYLLDLLCPINYTRGNNRLCNKKEVSKIDNQEQKNNSIADGKMEEQP